MNPYVGCSAVFLYSVRLKNPENQAVPSATKKKNKIAKNIKTLNLRDLYEIL